MSEIKSLCVFCGSSNRTLPKYGELATTFGKELVRSGICLVYGGAAVGLMGRLADTVMSEGGEAYGVIPRDMAKRSQFEGRDGEVAHSGLTKLELVDTMHERKQKMYSLADAFCGLPGGIGTLEELAEVLTWNGLGYHNKIKPIVLFDEGTYWDRLVDFLDYMVAEGFMRQEWRSWVGRATTPKQALEFLTRTLNSNTDL